MDRTLVSVAFLVLASSSFLFGVVHGAEFQDCAADHSLGKFKSISVSNCTADDAKCPLLRGHNCSISVEFETKAVIREVRQSVHGVIASMPIPFPLEANACKDTGLSCPLAVGAHTYQYSLFVKKEYPKISVEVKWELLNEGGKQIICMLIPAVLK